MLYPQPKQQTLANKTKLKKSYTNIVGQGSLLLYKNCEIRSNLTKNEKLLSREYRSCLTHSHKNRPSKLLQLEQQGQHSKVFILPLQLL